MKTFTNHHSGARGINLVGGGTRWVEAGETIEIDPKTIHGDAPDFGKARDAGDSDTNDLVASVQAENAELKKQVADQADTIKARDAEIAKLKKPAA